VNRKLTTVGHKSGHIESSSIMHLDSHFKVVLIIPPTHLLDFPSFSRNGTSCFFALGRASPSWPTFEGCFGSGVRR
jgi:hypothetical protein